VGNFDGNEQVNDLMKKYDDHFKKLPPDSLARLLYYAFRFTFITTRCQMSLPWK
jgi:hypothetical protein